MGETTHHREMCHPDKTSITRPGRVAPASCQRGVLTWGLVALLMGLAAQAMSQSTVTALLPRLNLSGYLHDTQPPPFESRTATGQTVSLADLKGHVVLLTFWASW